MYKEDPDIVPEDYQMLERRMEHFMGLHYEEDVIENGIGRLSLIKESTGNMNIKSINRGMCQLSKQREELARRWENSLAIHEKMEIELETLIGEKRTDPGIVFLNAVLLFSVISIGQIVVGISLFQGINVDNVTFNVFLGGIMVFLFGCMIRYGIRIYIYGRPITRLVQVGKGIIDALNHKNLLTEDKVKAEVLGDSAFYFIALKGGMSRDKELFAQCVMDFFNPLENQRYILVHPKRKKKIESYYVVPEAFSKRKEDAMLFAQCLEKHIGKYEPIYTRSPEGRKILLAGRRYAYSNRQQRCISRKRVKGGLE